MIIQIPQPKGTFVQINQGEQSGNLFASWNLDLKSNPPKMRVSPTLAVDTSSTDDATLVAPIAFVRNMANSGSVDTYFTVCDQAVFKLKVSDLGSTPFVKDASGPTTELSRLYSDAVNFNGSLIVSLKTDLAKLTAGTWTSSWWISGLAQSPFAANTPHPLCVGFTKELLIGNGNLVASVDITNTVNSARLTLDTAYEVMWIRSGSFAYWIGARHKYGGEAKVFKWDGASQYVVAEYGVASDITFAGVIKDEIPYTVNGRGQLLEFNGGGFQEIARFPITDNKNSVFKDGLTTYPININRNGMDLIDNNIHILLNAAIDDGNGTAFTPLLENMLSGVWQYTRENGLHHRYSISKVDRPDVDYGSPILVQAGALFSLNNTSKFFAGAELYVADGSTTSTKISVINTAPFDFFGKMGYFITPQFHVQDVEEIWQKAFLTFSKLINSGDFIKLSYRTSVNIIPTSKQLRDVAGLVGTWTASPSFTTNLSYFSTVVAGDEVEILSGEGSGLSSHIGTITNLAGTYTVTIENPVAGASGTINFRVAKWTKIDTVTDLVRAYKEFSVGNNSDWIQFKVVMYGTGNANSDSANSPEIEKLILLTKPQILATA